MYMYLKHTAFTVLSSCSYLFSKVNVLVAELILHTGSLSTEPNLVRWPSLHLASCHTLSGYISIAIECELHLLRLPRKQCAMQR